MARLYPSAWRRRYGAEYEALLEEATPRVRDVFDVFREAFKMQMTTWSFLRIVLVCSLVGALAAVGLSFSRPKLYKSQTLISVDTPDPQSIREELAGPVQDLLDLPFLASIIQRENLYPSERAKMPMNDVIELMRKEIRVAPLQKSDGKPASGFILEFVYPDAHVAQHVDAELTSRLMGSNLRARISSPSTASRGETFTVLNAADLPQEPFFPKRGVFGLGGLIAGLVGGLVLAGVVGWRRGAAVANV
jgi:hypothetical protein